MNMTGTQIGLIDAYAHAAGLDAANGINIKFFNATSGPAAVAGLISGSINFAPIGNLGFPLVEKGTDLYFLVGEARLSYEMIVRKNVNTPNLSQPYPAPVKDLKGLKIGITALGSTTDLYARTMLKDAGMSASDVTFIATGGVASGIAAFNAGRIDALVTFAPVEELIGAANYKVLVPSVTQPTQSPFTPGLLDSIVTTTKSYVTSHRATASAYCKTVAESIKALKDPSNIAKILPIAEKSMSLTKDQTVDVLARYAPLFEPQITEAGWNQLSTTTPGDTSGYVPSYANYVDATCQNIVAQVNGS
jgi:ABC-type nitrate/sulfonate/bicarbonate transport system substrate-binding protein